MCGHCGASGGLAPIARSQGERCFHGNGAFAEMARELARVCSCWKRPSARGYGAPSVKGGLLVVHHRESQEEMVERREAGSGASLWRHGDASQFSLIRTATTTGRARRHSADRVQSLLHFWRGREADLPGIGRRAKRSGSGDTARNGRCPLVFFGAGSSPIVEAPLLPIMVGGQPESAGMVALEAATGKTVWESVGQRNLGRGTDDGLARANRPSTGRDRRRR